MNNQLTEDDRYEGLINLNKNFEFIPCSMLIANNEGTIVRCNSACLNLLGSENPLVGYRLFNDPNFTPSLIARFTSESEFSVSIPYDFAKVTYSTCLREKQKTSS